MSDDVKGGFAVQRPPYVPAPLMVPWVAGRFYEAGFWAVAAAASTTSTDAVQFLPFYVPTRTTITSIGAESTGAGAAGSLARFAIYKDDKGRPGDLALDAGTVATNATGFLSIAVSQLLEPGWYWTAFVQVGNPGRATWRAYGSAAGHILWPNAGLSGTGTSNALLPSIDYGQYQTAIMSYGFTGRAVDAGSLGNDAGWTTNVVVRVMLGT